MRFLCALCVLCALLVPALPWTGKHSPSQSTTSIFAWSRTNTGSARAAKITLRNDSSQPQKVAALQVSSSLDWRSIRVNGKGVQFVSQSYTSDIDHTGALSEAIVTLPTEIKPKESLELDIG